MYRILFIAPLVFLIFGFSPLGFAGNEVPIFTEAQSVFEASLAGDKNETGTAIKQFEALVQGDPAHPLYLAYLGSSYTLKARDAWMPWTRLQNVEKGLGMIDKALLMLEPEHDTAALRGSIVSTETRLVAVSTFLQVPGFLNRLQAAKDVLAETLQTKAFEASVPIVKGRLYFRAAEIARREKNTALERGYLEKSLLILPEGRFREQAAQQLKGLEE